MLLAQLSLRWPRLLRFGTTVFTIALNNGSTLSGVEK
ncbi:hypothetical protein AF91_07105 [Lacticaseibacillus paracasei N1115]|uniref:Uncharacterized protein n=1 Tax=Lacticaseibacillus paracasei N1115 TaxID=1446494 RepID=A0A806LDN1_LACPA|nr:hypothetical protein AF91_07105 [Lacticaseibacillus paracasei N1115]